MKSYIKDQAHEQQYHNRLSVLCYKDVKLPRLGNPQMESTTKVLDLIKKRKSQYYSTILTEGDQEKILEVPPVQLPRLKTSMQICVQTDDLPTPEIPVKAQSRPQAVSLEMPTKNKMQRHASNSRTTNNKKPTAKTGVLKMFHHEEEHEQIEEENPEEEQFHACLARIPQLGRMRTVKNMTPFVDYLCQNNPFFRNVPPVIVSSLLKVCSIRSFSKNQQVYKKSEKLISFYIVLWGKVRVSDVLAGYKKICERGQTLCEHILFANEQPKLRLQNAKSLNESTLLQIPVFLYKKIYEELALYGYKSEFLMMESLIRRNFIEKQSQRQR